MTRILYNTSTNAFKSKGGGEIQLLKTKQQVEGQGFQVELFDGSQKLEDFDIFHNFNLHRDCFSAIERAKKAGLKIVITPIYWPGLRYAMHWNRPLKDRLKLVAVELINRLDFFGFSRVRKMLSMADLVLPGSLAEAAIFEKRFRLPTKKMLIVHNGVDSRFGKAGPDAFRKKYGLKDFVLYVGRIEERKNVLSLVRAMNGTGKKLVAIGDVKIGSEAYARKCREEAGENTLFLPGLNHSSKMLESAYAACKVFALPTWYETPGLAALEAGLAGANLVVTTEGCTREYFREFAGYARPDRVSNIMEKVLEGLGKPRNKKLQKHIAENFLWENTGLETKQAYEKLKGL